MHKTLVIFLFSLLLVPCGCAMLVRPPSRVVQATTVYLAEYGMHGTLVFPLADGAVQFDYGDHAYYAQDDKRILTGLRALAFPDTGALARRRICIPLPEDLPALKDLLQAETLFPLRVDATKAANLRDRLGKRFLEHSSTRTCPQVWQFAAPEEVGKSRWLYYECTQFIVDPDSYYFAHTCNQALANWLIELDCQVDGWMWCVDFKVEPSGSGDVPSTK
jgi:hypothetical protein